MHVGLGGTPVPGAPYDCSVRDAECLKHGHSQSARIGMLTLRRTSSDDNGRRG